MPQFKAVYNSPSGEREPYSQENVTDVLLFIILNHFYIPRPESNHKNSNN